jgi:large subunit ribosomal protein LP0
MVREGKSAWKSNYFLKLLKLVDEYPKCFIVGVDNVGSRQMQEIRIALRGHGEILMGKNTMIRKAIRGHLQQNPALEKILQYIVGNVGFVFTKGDLSDVKDKILAKKVAAPARAGALAPIDVIVPAQNTGMPPDKTSFFQALSIPTKISKGTIEILNDVHLIKKGEKVGASEATLLNMLNISPFTYGLVLQQVYDSGTVFQPEVLEITTADLRNTFLLGIRNVASISLAISYPNAASAPHLLANGLKNLLAVAAETDVTFKEAEKLKEYLKDPSKFAVAAAAAAPAPAAGKKEAPKKEEKKKEEEPEEEEDMGFGLFD